MFCVPPIQTDKGKSKLFGDYLCIKATGASVQGTSSLTGHGSVVARSRVVQPCNPPHKKKEFV